MGNPLDSASVITLTLHQLKRLVEGHIHLDGVETLDQVVGLIAEQAELCGCPECDAWLRRMRELFDASRA